MTDLLAPLAREQRFAMLALDQRESLRTMIAGDRGVPESAIADSELVAFKLAAVRALAPLATAVLIDRHFGLDTVIADRLLPSGCGLIVAADRLVQKIGQPVQDTYLDEDVDPAALSRKGAVALKLLVIWRRDQERTRRLRMCEEFVRRCRRAGLASVLEGVVRPTAAETAAGWDREEAIVAATAELSSVGPSLYKVEVPLCGTGAPEVTSAWCRRVDAACAVPWVVLSQGVEPAHFAAAVGIACRAGASGFLAGRGVWRDCVADQDRQQALASRARDRLAVLSRTVRDQARPYLIRSRGQ
jgi:sulfofructosephosphate aldolase